MSESDVSDECEKQFNEDQELEQLINGQICFKIYPFGSGIVKPLSRSNINTVRITFYIFVDFFFSLLVAEIPAERKIILPGSFNPLHDGHLKLMEVATRYINSCYLLKDAQMYRLFIYYLMAYS